MLSKVKLIPEARLLGILAQLYADNFISQEQKISLKTLLIGSSEKFLKQIDLSKEETAQNEDIKQMLMKMLNKFEYRTQQHQHFCSLQDAIKANSDCFSNSEGNALKFSNSFAGTSFEGYEQQQAKPRIFEKRLTLQKSESVNYSYQPTFKNIHPAFKQIKLEEEKDENSISDTQDSFQINSAAPILTHDQPQLKQVKFLLATHENKSEDQGDQKDQVKTQHDNEKAKITKVKLQNFENVSEFLDKNTIYFEFENKVIKPSQNNKLAIADSQSLLNQLYQKEIILQSSQNQKETAQEVCQPRQSLILQVKVLPKAFSALQITPSTMNTSEDPTYPIPMQMKLDIKSARSVNDLYYEHLHKQYEEAEKNQQNLILDNVEKFRASKQKLAYQRLEDEDKELSPTKKNIHFTNDNDKNINNYSPQDNRKNSSRSVSNNHSSSSESPHISNYDRLLSDEFIDQSVFLRKRNEFLKNRPDLMPAQHLRSQRSKTFIQNENIIQKRRDSYDQGMQLEEQLLRKNEKKGKRNYLKRFSMKISNEQSKQHILQKFNQKAKFYHVDIEQKNDEVRVLGRIRLGSNKQPCDTQYLKSKTIKL